MYREQQPPDDELVKSVAQWLYSTNPYTPPGPAKPPLFYGNNRGPLVDADREKYTGMARTILVEGQIAKCCTDHAASEMVRLRERLDRMTDKYNELKECAQ